MAAYTKDFSQGYYQQKGTGIVAQLSEPFVVGQHRMVGLQLRVNSNNLALTFKLKGSINGGTYIDVPFNDGASTVTSIAVTAGNSIDKILGIDPAFESSLKVDLSSVSGSHADNEVEVVAVAKGAS